MKKLLATISVIALMTMVHQVHAQYNFAVGVRSGGTSGLTLKAITSPTTAVEGIIGFWNDGLSFTGIFEKHPQAFDVEGLHWMLGVGAHVAFYEDNFRGKTGPAWYDDHPEIVDGDLGLGVDAKAGIEYKFPVIPLAVSVGFKPFLEFTTEGEVWLSADPGVGLKLAF